MGFAILFEASISFLGLGVQPPDASWGSMLGRSTRFFEQSPYLVIVPGMMILVTVLCFNLIGDGVRDSLGREVRRG
jgi:ABC-type dipeptide/oligopeptide/nickel transport system permease subunit